MVFIDATVVGVALPVLQRDLHASAAQAQWIIEAYTLALGALMLLGGAIADRAGRKRIFLIGLAIFLAGSVATGAAPGIEFAILARVVQGIGGMLMAPASLAIIGGCFEGAERDKAVGTWSAFTAITTLLSPVLGGALVGLLGWRSVFYINIPVGLLTAYAAFVHVPETRDTEAHGRLDIAGSVFGATGLGAIVYVLTALSGEGARPALLGVLGAAGVLALTLFLFEERRAENPIMPLRLFASRTFSGVNLLTLMLYGALGANLYFLPFDLIQVHGYSPAQSGAALLPFMICVSVLSRWSANILTRVGARAVLTVGTLIVACGFVLFDLLSRSGSYWTGVFPPILTIGIGMGLVVAPLTTTVMDSVPVHNVGVASGINNATARIGGLLAIALGGAIMWGAFNANLDRELQHVHLGPAQSATLASQRPRLAGGTYRDPVLVRAVHGAYDRAFDEVALLCAGLAAIAAVTAYTMVGSASRQPVLRSPSH